MKSPSNKLRNYIKNKNETVCPYLQKLSVGKDTEYSLWKVTKRPSVQLPTIRKYNKNLILAKSNKEKGDTFTKHLELTFKLFLKQTEDETIDLKTKNSSVNISLIKFNELKKL